MNPTYRYQPEWRRLGCLTTLKSVIQRLSDKSADADPVRFGCATHLLCKLVVK